MNYRVMQGAQLKTWHYFQHTKASPSWEPRVFFHPDTVWDDDNPWRGERGTAWPEYLPHEADALFIDGRHNWMRLPPGERERWPRPVIATIQGFRHVHPDKRHIECLAYRAVRCCVSEEVRAAIATTGRVQGPTCVIPNGMDLPGPPPPNEAVRLRELFVCGLKKPALAEMIAARLRELGWQIEVAAGRLPRAGFLDAMQRADATLFLPEEREGFYLPALEGMALGTSVICPDVLGNRSFCLDGINCLRPRYTLEGLLGACEFLRRLSPDERRRMRMRAAETAAEHTLQRERERFLFVLEQVEDAWRTDTEELNL